MSVAAVVNIDGAGVDLSALSAPRTFVLDSPNDPTLLVAIDVSPDNAAWEPFGLVSAEQTMLMVLAAPYVRARTRSGDATGADLRVVASAPALSSNAAAIPGAAGAGATVDLGSQVGNRNLIVAGGADDDVCYIEGSANGANWAPIPGLRWNGSSFAAAFYTDVRYMRAVRVSGSGAPVARIVSVPGVAAPPTGPAGGILEGTYPDPTGLSASVPIGDGGAGGAVLFKADGAEAGEYAGNLAFNGATGGAADADDPGGLGSNLSISGGPGGVGSAAQAAGQGGNVTVAAGFGGASGGGGAGAGGSAFLQGGGGGGAGGAVAGGAGGNVEVKAGSGGPSGAGNSGMGGAAALLGGTGGVASVGASGQLGGNVTVEGGTGGAGGAAQPAGPGGAVAIQGGAGGADGGGGGANGGNVLLDAGNPTGAGTAGRLFVGGNRRFNMIDIVTPNTGDVAAGSVDITSNGTLAALNIEFPSAQSGLHVNAVKVVGEQQAAVPDAAGGATVDAEARAAINALLQAMRNHGLIAP